MATTSTSSNILAGIQSIGGNRQAARLKAYNENLAERQVYDTTSELLAGQIQQQEKQNKFISNALGIKSSPSSDKMWDSHHALLSEEYEAMFNDDVLKAVSQDETLSAKWLADLNALNQRISEAEQFFAISFGDPSKGADQASYSGWRNATQDGTMEYNDYWKTQGLSTSVTNQDIKNKAAELDTKAHTNVEYVPGQGFNVTYEDGKEGLFDFSPQNASTIFFAPVEQATFNPPVNYANDQATYSLYKNSGEKGLRENLQSRKDQMELDVAEFALQEAIAAEEDTDKKAGLEAMTVRQYRDKLVREGTFDNEYNSFENAVVESMKARDEKEAKAKRSEPTDTKTTKTPQNSNFELEVISDNQGNRKIEFSGLRKMQHDGKLMSIRSVERKSNGQYVVNLVYNDEIVPVEFSTGDSTDQELQKRIKDQYGDKIIPQIVKAMETSGVMSGFN